MHEYFRVTIWQAFKSPQLNKEMTEPRHSTLGNLALKAQIKKKSANKKKKICNVDPDEVAYNESLHLNLSLQLEIQKSC